ncbi:TorD/DmsD family molecular chaperone [Desulfitobacterium metallireducens]|uniref:Dehydrogenase n=1 Tax=Desulfitobacterium metallireducens DSM 15288 TaxID=871968 RepID=W0EG54_9FIRM|nr:molecular chaperone TorD family protein [Desulfitobacterium metallireducens]AHF08164.1 dehydrogenase [Desulfitobacterium metallireducens DSM 15288]
MNQENGSKAQPLLEMRVLVYDILRRTFLEEPTKEFLNLIMDKEFTEEFPFAEENEEIHEGIAQIAVFLQEHDLKSEKEYNDLLWDYTRLFIGPDKLPAPLWESAYLNKERLLFQEQTLKVRHAYLEYQFLPKYFRQEADDHLGLELDFMYQLSELSLNYLQHQDFMGLRKVLTDQKTFLQEHLLKWVPELTAKILDSSNLSFYPGMAKILNGYLTLDLEALVELLDMDYESVSK